MRDTWERTSIRVTDLMVTPDFTRLVAVGMYDSPAATAANPQDAAAPQGGAGAVPGANTGASANKSSSETRIIIYDLSTKQPESCVFPLCGLRGVSVVVVCKQWTLIGCPAFTGRYGSRASSRA